MTDHLHATWRKDEAMTADQRSNGATTRSNGRVLYPLWAALCYPDRVMEEKPELYREACA